MRGGVLPRWGFGVTIVSRPLSRGSWHAPDCNYFGPVLQYYDFLSVRVYGNTRISSLHRTEAGNELCAASYPSIPMPGSTSLGSTVRFSFLGTDAQVPATRDRPGYV